MTALKIAQGCSSFFSSSLAFEKRADTVPRMGKFTARRLLIGAGARIPAAAEYNK